MGAWVDLRPGQRVPRPARLRRPQQRPDPARRARLLRQRLPAGGVPGLALPPRRRSPVADLTPPGGDRAEACSGQAATCCASSTQSRVERLGTRRRARGGHRQLRTGLPHADRRARTDGPRERDRRRRSELYGLDDPKTEALRPAVPDRPAAGRARRAVRRAALSQNLGHDRWDQHSQPEEGPRGQRPRRRQADRRAAART